MPQHKNSCPGNHEFTILVDPFLVIIHFVCPNHAPQSKKRFFKKYINFTHFTPNLPPIEMKGHEIYIFLSPYPNRCYIPNLVKIGLIVLEKKMLTDDARRRAPIHNKRSPD